ncbi:MAG: group III truncated hemoglobin [Aliidongia sp.]
MPTLDQPAAPPVLPTEEAIFRLVDGFYADIRRDPSLGPIFERAIGADWPAHLDTMNRFWSSVMLTSGRYKGNPMVVHLRVPGIAPELFARCWRCSRPRRPSSSHPISRPLSSPRRGESPRA